MLSKLTMATCLAAPASGCVSAEWVSSQAMAYDECNNKTSVEWGEKHHLGSVSTALGRDVEAYCRGQVKIFVPLEKQLLRSLENANRIENASEAR